MIQKFLSVPLFVVELGVVYGVTIAASAAATSVPVVASSTIETPREVRLVVVPSTPAQIATTTPLNDVSDEYKSSSTPITTRAAVASPVITTPAELVLESVEPGAEAATRDIQTVPFYSQFTDISSPQWQKVGCGIASLAMLIDYYSDETISVEQLLERGIAAGAYLDNAGWIHSGLIGLSNKYDLDGESRSLANLPADDAFDRFVDVLDDGPVMASVHYTFEPTNPIPHLVVVTGVRDGKVFYNDPAESAGGGSLSIAKFKRAWKQRYIIIRPGGVG